VKSGNSESATFIRNVPEPQRQFSMRRRNPRQGERIDEVEVEQLGLIPAATAAARMVSPLSVSTPTACPIFDNDPVHPRRKPMSTP